MAWELIYTSAPRGVIKGESGFCPVLMTRGIAPELSEALIQLSAYRFLYPLNDTRINTNPVNFQHIKLPWHNNGCYHVVSRIGYCGLDFMERANRIAHHYAYHDQELATAMPGFALAAQENLFYTEYREAPQLKEFQYRIPETPVIAPGFRFADAWEEAAGHSKYAALLAKAFCNDPNGCIYIRFDENSVSDELRLAMVLQIGMLLPAAQQLQFTFSTFCSTALPAESCFLRFFHAETELPGTESPEELLRQKRLLDLSELKQHHCSVALPSSPPPPHALDAPETEEANAPDSMPSEHSAEAEGKELLEEINRAFGNFDYIPLKRALHRYQELRQNGLNCTLQELRQLHNAERYFVQEHQKRNDTREFSSLAQQMETLLENRAPLSELEQLFHRMELLALPMDELLLRRYMNYQRECMDEAHRHGYWQMGLFFICGIAFATLLFFSGSDFILQYQSRQYRHKISAALLAKDLPEAFRLFQEVDQRLPKLNSHTEFQLLRQTLAKALEHSNRQSLQRQEIVEQLDDKLDHFSAQEAFACVALLTEAGFLSYSQGDLQELEEKQLQLEYKLYHARIQENEAYQKTLDELERLLSRTESGTETGNHTLRSRSENLLQQLDALTLLNAEQRLKIDQLRHQFESWRAPRPADTVEAYDMIHSPSSKPDLRLRPPYLPPQKGTETP